MKKLWPDLNICELIHTDSNNIQEIQEICDFFVNFLLAYCDALKVSISVILTIEINAINNWQPVQSTVETETEHQLV